MPEQSLNYLICNDLTQLATNDNQMVPSEESIRLMIHAINQKGANRSPITLIVLSKLEDYLKSLLEQQATQASTHYQFMIEFGERSPSQKGNPGNIHYTALDLFIRHSQKPIALFTDHSRAKIDPDLKSIFSRLNIQFAVSGDFSGHPRKLSYQSDEVHCPIFTLVHLQNTMEDDGLLQLLEQSPIMEGEPDITLVSWETMPPHYLIYAQSVSNSLFNWIDMIKEREKSPKHEESSVLQKAHFSIPLSKTLKEDSNHKVINQAIRFKATELAKQTQEFLKSGKLSCNELIKICYQDKYPLTFIFFNQVLSASSEENSIFEWSFSQAHILENFLKNEEFHALITNKFIITLMQKSIDASDLLALIIIRALKRGMNKDVLLSMNKNLNCLPIICGDEACLSKLSQHDIFTLLLSKKTHQFFKDPILSQLFVNGIITLSMIEKIIPFSLNKEAEYQQIKHDTEKAADYLKKKFDSKVKEEEVSRIAIKEDPLFAEVDTCEVSSRLPQRKLMVSLQLEDEVLSDCNERDLFDVPIIATPVRKNSLSPIGLHLGLFGYSLFSKEDVSSEETLQTRVSYDVLAVSG